MKSADNLFDKHRCRAFSRMRLPSFGPNLAVGSPTVKTKRTHRKSQLRHKDHRQRLSPLPLSTWGLTSATERIDARGLTVAPGFIDIHSHSDYSMLREPKGESMVRQGVTTQILGEGPSAGPVKPEKRGLE